MQHSALELVIIALALMNGCNEATMDLTKDLLSRYQLVGDYFGNGLLVIRW